MANTGFMKKLRFFLLTICPLLAIGIATARAENFKVLLFTKTAGFRHASIPDAITAFQQLAATNNFSVTNTEDSAVFSDANLAQFRVVVFLMTTGDILNSSQEAAFEKFIQAGNGYVGVHSASDTEYGWPWYGNLMGAYFEGHPAPAPATIRVEDLNHPSTSFLPADWVRTDEWYNFQTNPRMNVHVLARLDESTYGGGTMGDHPIAWCHEYDGGRAWYTAGGHTPESYSEPLFRQHLLGGILYAAGGVTQTNLATPAFTWAHQIGSTNIDHGRAITVDSGGNIYVTGDFQNTANFGSTNLVSAGSFDCFLAKYTSAGNLIWLKQISGTGDDEPFGLTLDNLGNPCVVGQFANTISFGTTNLTSAGNWEIFVAKYDTSGNLIWARRAGGTGQDAAVDVAADKSGNLFVSGYFRTNASFGSFALTAASSPNNAFSDGFIAKYDSGGNVIWARGFGGSGNDVAFKAVPDDAGNVSVTGFFNNTANFGATNLTSAGSDEIFIAKYSSAGNLLWVKQAGGIGSDEAGDLIMDNAGNSYISGYFSTNATFGSTNLTSAGKRDGFLAKYDSAGNFLWVKQLAGTDDDIARKLAIDGMENVFLTGEFVGPSTFGNTVLNSGGKENTFILKCDRNGNALWSQTGGGTNDSGRSIAINGTGTIYATGFYGGTATYGSITLTNAGILDIFIARLDELFRLSVNDIGGQAVLSWPTNAIGFTLQTSTNLNSSANWLDSINAPSIFNGQYRVTNALFGGSKFYRLKK